MRQILWVIIIVSICYQCATVGSLGGGPRDERAPQLDTLYSTPNMLTNFTVQDITLAFDEWIKLENVFTQIVISPPIEPLPEFKIQKKSVVIEFEEGTELRENATYTINFGEAVKDLTESNPAEDLRFVFSTGDFIDSLTVSGTVRDLMEGEAVEDALVMLYDNLADSVVRTERPFYFARTDESGSYQIQNVRADTFKVFVLKEDIGNYLYDSDLEFIGFPDSLLVLDTQSVQNYDFIIFQEEPDLFLQRTDTTAYGLANLIFNKKPRDLDFQYEAIFDELYFNYESDSLRLWYDITDSVGQFIVRQDTLMSDTLILTSARRAAFLASASLGLLTPKSSIRQNPVRPLALTFQRPLATIDSTLINVYADTTKTPANARHEIDTTNIRNLRVRVAWQEMIPYEVVILPNAITDIYGIRNQDTIQQAVTVQSSEDFGSLILTVTDLDSTQQYVVKVGTSGAPPIGEFVVSDVSEWQQTFTAIPTGKYEVEIVSDHNRNGRWDTGSYQLRTKAEPIFSQTLEQLRPSWDLEAEVKLQTPNE